MNLSKAYRYCPKCTGPLEPHARFHLRCSHCRLEFYFNPAPCAAAIIENDRGEILLVVRRQSPGRGRWALPGGFIDPGEDLDCSIRREIKEELGIEIKTNRIVGIYNDRYRYQNFLYPTIGIVVGARALSSLVSANEEVMDWHFFPKNEVLGQTFAFPSAQKALNDYLRGKKELFPFRLPEIFPKFTLGERSSFRG